MMTPRDKRFPVLLTDAEYKLFKRFAESKHTTMSEWLRQLAHREIDQSKVQAA